jgi:hypothetical protein
MEVYKKLSHLSHFWDALFLILFHCTCEHKMNDIDGS